MAKRRQPKSAGSTAQNRVATQSSSTAKRGSASVSSSPTSTPESAPEKRETPPAEAAIAPPKSSAVGSTKAAPTPSVQPDFQALIHERDRQIAVQQEENKALQAQLEDLKHQVAALQADLKTAQDAKTTSDQQCQTLEQEAIAHKTQIQALEAQVEEYAVLKKAHTKLQKEAAKLETSVATLTMKLDTQAEENGKAIAQLQAQLQQKDTEYTEALNHLHQKIADLTDMQDSWQSEKSALQQQLHDAQHELSMQRLNTQTLQTAHDRLQQEVVALQEQLSQSQTLAHLGELQVNRWRRTFAR